MLLIGLVPNMATSEPAVPHEVAKDMRLLGLAIKWDDVEAIRQRMRERFNLLIHFDIKLKKKTNFAVQRSLSDVKANVDVLAPVCHLIRQTKKTPEIEPLEKEVQQMFALYNVPVKAATINDQAWAIRHLITVLRSTVRPSKPGTPPGFARMPKD